MNKEQLQFFYDEIMGEFGWDDGDEASGVDPLLWAKKQLAQLRADNDVANTNARHELAIRLDVQKQLDKLLSELATKDAALDEAEKVIKFYGTLENWVNDHVDIGVGNMPIPETSECGHDMGRKASAWLSAHPAKDGEDA